MKIVLGTVQFGLDYGINNSDGRLKEEEIFDLLNFTYESGIQEIDTADDYGNACDIIGKYLQTGKPFELMSKFTLKEKMDLSTHFNISLKRLKVERLKGYYFHKFQDYRNYISSTPLIYPKNLTYLGLSVYSDLELEIAVKDENINLIQVPFNLFDCSERKIKLLMEGKAKGKLIYTRSTFLQGLFFKDFSLLPEKLKPFERPLTILHQIAKEASLTIGELALVFCLQQRFIDKVLIGVDSKKQLKQNLKMTSLKLSKETLKKITEIKILNRELLHPGNW